jgi:hypothetical protein
MKLAQRLYGEPPAMDTPTSERLRFIRRFYIRPLPLTLLVFVLLIVDVHRTWVFVVLAVLAVVWVQGVASLSLRIRREERREASTAR